MREKERERERENATVTLQLATVEVSTTMSPCQTTTKATGILQLATV